MRPSSCWSQHRGRRWARDQSTRFKNFLKQRLKKRWERIWISSSRDRSSIKLENGHLLPLILRWVYYGSCSQWSIPKILSSSRTKRWLQSSSKQNQELSWEISWRPWTPSYNKHIKTKYRSLLLDGIIVGPPETLMWGWRSYCCFREALLDKVTQISHLLLRAPIPNWVFVLTCLSTDNARELVWI